MLKSMQTQTAPISRDQLREEIQNSVRDAQIAAEKAAREAITAAQQAQGVTMVPPPLPQEDIPPGAIAISVTFFIVVGAVIIGLPIMRALARRIDRKSAQPPQISNEVQQQLHQLSASVEAIAIEVERISEGQRFTTKMLAERSREGTSA